ncbi:DUF58 domain-containing protein [Microbacterium horticulturae]|uniref:DUF58 domain-containing protein n=1 Tax=Microbacterium horticulturae TaxID=3028316 RepID=A0ABY8C6H9_9MICO|nr:DUF58 domain-containing protein [Microbacterium sp. KACC 23027]WEG10203.1 DUF58 domain-containing protein [Microbacterium sp. KACC 23027]
MRGIASPASAAGIGTGVVLLAAALGFGRVDLAVAGALLLVAAATAMSSRRGAGAQMRIDRDQARAGGDGKTLEIPTRIALSVPDAEVLVVTTTAPGRRTRHTAVAGPTAEVPVQVRTVHSGDQDLLAVDALAVGRDGAWTMSLGPGQTVRARIDPHARALRDLPLPRVPSGLTGAHDAPRPGDGGEFRDIHPFAPGDRLQRIDWKATARLGRRPGDLYVRRTLATSDIDVAVVLDDGDDLAGVLGDWVRGDPGLGLPTSMDVAREAAWSLATAYLDRADQVSFQVLSRLSSAVPRGSGARHRERLRSAIAVVTAQQRMVRSRTPLVPANALVVLLSTFLDDEPVRLAGLWRAGGHRVVTVDVLPQLRTERLRREELAAARIVLGSRADRLADVRAMGADVLVWDAEPGARAAALRAMTRQRRRG